MKTIFRLTVVSILFAMRGIAADLQTPPAHGQAKHVVLVVWDGMRPDFATEEYAPTLYRLSREGVFFQKNHSAYVTSTEVNGTVLATGVYPNRSHLIANREYRPGIDAATAVPTESITTIRKGDEDGKYLNVATLEETLQAHGYPTVIAGTKAVALLPDRSEKRTSDSAKKSGVIYAGQSNPASLIEDVTRVLGMPFPPTATFPNTDEDAWTTRALTEFLWKDGVPKFSLLWMSDPDFSQHNTAPGSPIALGAIKSDDDNLAKVLAVLEAKGVRDKTDVIVVSDHGFSTVEKNSDVVTDLTAAGFSATVKFKGTPKDGDILVGSVSGSLLLYVTGHDPATTQKLVDFFQKAEYTGVIFTREKMKGTFTLEQGRLNSPEAPDVLVSLRWSDAKNKYGVPGSIYAEVPRKPGTGMHATLSKFDIHNTLVAAGPDFKHGMLNDLPTGNVDVVPTILWLLGVPPSEPLDGRVLFEAIAGAPEKKMDLKEEMLSAERIEGDIHWSQQLKFTHLGPYLYLDEGTGEKAQP